MKIMFVGDVCMGEYYMSFGHGPRSFAKSNEIFSSVQDIFDSADMVIGNLEAPITHLNYDHNEPESMVLKVDPDHTKELKNAGFGVMQVANNHTIQHGEKAFEETLELFNKEGLKAVGLNQQDPVVIDEKGISIAILAASDVPDNTDKTQSKYQRLDEDFLNKIEHEVKKYDHLIVMFHWGLESSTSPLPYQRELVERLYKAGVRAVIGTHPHLFYEIEKRDNFISAYSLGNFVFDLCWDKRLIKTGILEIDFTKKNINAKYWPVIIKKNGCLPTPNGHAIPITKTIIPYDLGTKMEFQQVKKVIYLLKNIFKGHTFVKMKFFQRKIARLFASQ